jgi:hypothetical protein
MKTFTDGNGISWFHESVGCMTENFTKPNFHTVGTIFNLLILLFSVSKSKQHIFALVFAWVSP